MIDLSKFFLTAFETNFRTPNFGELIGMFVEVIFIQLEKCF